MTLCGTCGIALGAGTCGACAAYGTGFSGSSVFIPFATPSHATAPGWSGRPQPFFARRQELELPRELAAEPIVAWRSWDADPSGVLKSVGAGSAHPGTWATRDATARCDRCTYLLGTPPGLNCSCGLYASKDNQWRGIVSGKVALYGKVIEHEHGYRAQHARILELHTDDPMLAALLRLTYGVPVTASPPAPPGGVVPPAFQRQVTQRALGGGPFVTTPPKLRRSRWHLALGLLNLAAVASGIAAAAVDGAPSWLTMITVGNAFAAGCYATLYLRPRS